MNDLERERSRRYGAVGDAVRVVSLETQSYIDRAARRLGHHRSDVLALGVLIAAGRDGGGLTPGDVARRVNLSAAAVTALLDRLSRAGHVRRSPHERDGRRTVIAASPRAHEMSRNVFSGLTAAHRRALADYSDSDLDLVARVLTDLAEATRRASREEEGWADGAAGGAASAEGR